MHGGRVPYRAHPLCVNGRQADEASGVGRAVGRVALVVEGGCRLELVEIEDLDGAVSIACRGEDERGGEAKRGAGGEKGREE